MQPKIINLTPHPINVVDKYGKVIMTFPPSGLVARCDVDLELDKVLEIDGVEIPIYRTTFGEVSNLPREEPDTFYIVSAAVAKAEIERRDLLIPNDLLRDKSGTIIGCHSFAIPNKEVTMDTRQRFELFDLVARVALAVLLGLILKTMAQASATLQENLGVFRLMLMIGALGGVDREWRLLFNLLILAVMVFAVVLLVI